jgi:serine O-acetyltransferase
MHLKQTLKFEQTLSNTGLAKYATSQMNNFFPDETIIEASEVEQYLPEAIERIYASFSWIKNKYYRHEGSVFFNHQHSDQYCSFLYLLGNTAFHHGNTALATKTFLLNKALHGIDLYYSVQLPEIFLVVHPVGSVIGNAKYENFLTVYQGCTVGATIKSGNYIYPEIGEHATLFAKSTVIGNSKIGSNTIVGANTFIMDSHIPANSIVTGVFPELKIKPAKHSDNPFFL